MKKDGKNNYVFPLSPTRDTRHATRGTRHATRDTRRTARDARHDAAHGTQCSVAQKHDVTDEYQRRTKTSIVVDTSS